jgi:hypothetical protein
LPLAQDYSKSAGRYIHAPNILTLRNSQCGSSKQTANTDLSYIDGDDLVKQMMFCKTTGSLSTGIYQMLESSEIQLLLPYITLGYFIARTKLHSG